jgi:hypothetical protein
VKKLRSHKKPLRNEKKEAQQRPKKVSNAKRAETKDNLTEMLKEYEAKLKFYGFKVARLRDLLSRRSIESATEKKRQRLTKMFEEASEEYSFAQVAIDQITFRISQVQ